MPQPLTAVGPAYICKANEFIRSLSETRYVDINIGLIGFYIPDHPLATSTPAPPPPRRFNPLVHTQKCLALVIDITLYVEEQRLQGGDLAATHRLRTEAALRRIRRVKKLRPQSRPAAIQVTIPDEGSSYKAESE